MRYLIMPVVIGCAAQQDKPIENLEEEILYCADGAYPATFSVWSDRPDEESFTEEELVQVLQVYGGSLATMAAGRLPAGFLVSTGPGPLGSKRCSRPWDHPKNPWILGRVFSS